MPKRCFLKHRFFSGLGSILEGLGLPRWNQVRRAACSARRVKPYCIFAFGKPVRKYLEVGGESPNARPKSRPVGNMLAHFSLLGAFFRVLGVACAFLGDFLLVLAIFWVSWNAPGSILENFEEVWGTFWKLRASFFDAFLYFCAWFA